MRTTLSIALALFVPLLSAQTGPNQIPLSTLTLNGSAQYTSNIIELTNTTSQAGSAFVPSPYKLGANDEFEVMFAYHSFGTGLQPADGFAFVAQNAAGPNYLGTGGSGLGFFTFTTEPAIAATFDYYVNSYTGTQPGAVAVAGSVGIDLHTAYPGPVIFGGAGAGGVRYVWVDYNNATRVFAIYYSGAETKPTMPTVEYTLTNDLSSRFGGQVYFGFTGGTGALSSVQRIDSMAVSVVNK